MDDSRRLRTMRLISAQRWSEFKTHWPMELLHLLIDIGGGFVFGVALSLAVFIQLMAVVVL